MDDGAKVGNGLKLSTNNFTQNEVLKLCNIFLSKYNIKVNIQSAGNSSKDQYIIYVPVDSMPKLVKIIKPYIHPSMKYKIIKYL
jgi:hypothetical protein